MINKCGNFSAKQCNFGYFRLDGGSMFGSVPKNIWSKRIPADHDNCIRLATRSLILSAANRVFLIDVGMGEKWNDKSRQIYGIDNLSEENWGFKREDITDLILTHLHFDHAGGVSAWSETGEAVSLYPKALIHLQRENLVNAKNPSLKERASYLKENYGVVERSQKLNLLNGTTEIYPGLLVHCVNGHTRGQQWIEVKGTPALFYATDLIPTSHHLPLPFHMGYDACAETLLKEKSIFLKRALDEGAVVVFEHDAEVAAATIKLDERGHYAVDEVVSIDVFK